MAQSNRTNVLGVAYDNLTQAEAIARALGFVEAQTKAHVCFVNADCVYQAQRDAEYRSLLRDAPLVLSDGVGLAVATRLLGGRMVDNCNGSDLSPLLMAQAARRGYGIYLLGGQPGVAERAADRLRQSIPEIRIVGTDHGYHDADDDSVIDRINASGAEILFVGLGVPRQEKWICRHRNRLRPTLCLGVGALLDFLSGRVTRAPVVLRTMRLEWTWRLLLEPRRMVRRYVMHGGKFAASVLAEAVRQRRQRGLRSAPDPRVRQPRGRSTPDRAVGLHSGRGSD